MRHVPSEANAERAPPFERSGKPVWEDPTAVHGKRAAGLTRQCLVRYGDRRLRGRRFSLELLSLITLPPVS